MFRVAVSESALMLISPRLAPPIGSSQKHFGLALGYGVLHISLTDYNRLGNFTVSQTLNSPQFGFGIYF
jgi:hypothetical protein